MVRKAKKTSSPVELKAEIAEAIAEPATERQDERTKRMLKPRNLLSSGCPTLDLACSDCVDGAFLKGKYYLFVGASSAGKTWVSLTMLAESSKHPRFKNYRIIYDAVEEGANMDFEYYFGKTTARRIESPEPDRKDEDGLPQPNSRTVDQFYDSLENRLKDAAANGYGIIYVLDSMDGLGSDAAVKKAEKNKKAREDGKEEKGSYGDGKAKANSQRIRDMIPLLEKTGSMLFIICQERDDIGSRYAGAKTFSGGTALLFYATLQVWYKKQEDIKATIKGATHVVGILSKVAIKKNRLTGQQFREIMLPIYHSFGIDSTGAMVNWLVDNGHWTGGGTLAAKITATEFGVELPAEKLVRHIEDNNLETELKAILQGVWAAIKQEIAERIRRKPRYE